jgi:hypothetical protein
MTPDEFARESALLRAKVEARRQDVAIMTSRLSDPYLKGEVLARVGWWLGDSELVLKGPFKSDSARASAIRMATTAYALADAWANEVEAAMKAYGDDVRAVG